MGSIADLSLFGKFLFDIVFLKAYDTGTKKLL